MNKEEVAKVLIQVLREIQLDNGREEEPISLETRPVGGISGFDSLNIIEATVVLIDKISPKITEKVFNIDKIVQGKQCPTVDEISNAIVKLVNG